MSTLDEAEKKLLARTSQLDGFEDVDLPNLVKPRILLMGLQRSGKSSILKVVFYKMSPHETLFLESTSSVEKSDISNSSFIQFQIWDFPGQIDFFSNEVNTSAIFRGCNAIIFVIDAQDDHTQALTKLHTTAIKAHEANPEIRFEVFIHKSDGISDEERSQILMNIKSQISEDWNDSSTSNKLKISFYSTSIYDHSIFEAFSKVVQKLIPQMSSLQALHDTLNSSCRIEKSFLFDVISKIYISTDGSAVDMASYELCSYMIDVVIDISSIYGMNENEMGLAYDAKSAAVIKLSNGMVLYLRHINRFLAIVCIMGEECLERQGLIDYNIGCFKDGVAKLFLGTA